MFTQKQHKGFTLVELLTVIAIIAILGAILIPAVGTIRAKANMAQGVSNLRQIGTALGLYLQDNENQLPAVSLPPDETKGETGKEQWTKQLRDFLPQRGSSGRTKTEHEIFACPNAVYYKNGQVAELSEISRSYSATEAMFGFSEGTLRQEIPRHIEQIGDHSNTLLVVDAKQSGTTYTACYSGTRWTTASTDIGRGDPEATTTLDFRQPGERINVLYIDGRVDSISFADASKLVSKNWDGR